MNEKILWGVFIFAFLLFSFITFLPLNDSLAVECCTDYCTNERYAECNGISMDFCSTCIDSSYFCYHCSRIACEVCSGFQCNGSCSADCSIAQDLDCVGFCCGNGACDVTENN